jgi:hypothetical protein
MKRQASVGIAVLLISMLSPLQVAIAATDCSAVPSEKFDGGTGTVTDPYQVHNVAALDEMRCYLDKNFVLTTDISIPSTWGGAAGWNPIGIDSQQPFAGTLNGAGFEISGLKIDLSQNTGGYSNAGLFGYVDEGRISNLLLREPIVVGDKQGGIAGSLAGQVYNSVVERIVVVNSQVSNDRYSGGVVGYVWRSVFFDIEASTIVRPIPSSTGLVGNYHGGFAAYSRESNHVDVNLQTQILVMDSSNQSAAVSHLGGFVGEPSTFNRFHNLNLDVLIEADTNYKIQEIAGVGSATHLGSVANLKAQVELKLGKAAAVARASCIAGRMSFTSSILGADVTCTISAPSGSELIAGLAHSANDGAIADRVQLHAEIELGSNPETVGFLVANAGGFSVFNSVFTGSLEIDQSTTAQSVGLVSGNVNFAAIAASNTILAITSNLDKVNGTDVGGAVGLDQKSSRVPKNIGVLLDSELLGYTLESQDLKLESVSTTNLKSKDYLTARGFDFESVWEEVADNYPKLRFGPLVVTEVVTVPIAVTPLSIQQVSTPEAAGISRSLLLTSNYKEVSVRVLPQGLELFSRATTSGVEVLIPAELSEGSYDLEVSSAGGTIRLLAAIKVAPLQLDFNAWSKKISNDQAKVYVKNPMAQGKVEILVNGKEVAWVNAKDETDPKLRVSNGHHYLVRTLNLADGKNRVEVRVAGERVWFATYSR